jgi:hypothetical protein
MAIPVVFVSLMLSGCTARKQASGIYVSLLRVARTHFQEQRIKMAST